MDSHCFDADPDPDLAQNLVADPDPGGGGRGVGQPKMCIPPGKILGMPLAGCTFKISVFQNRARAVVLASLFSLFFFLSPPGADI